MPAPPVRPTRCQRSSPGSCGAHLLQAAKLRRVRRRWTELEPLFFAGMVKNHLTIHISKVNRPVLHDDFRDFCRGGHQSTSLRSIREGTTCPPRSQVQEGTRERSTRMVAFRGNTALGFACSTLIIAAGVSSVEGFTSGAIATGSWMRHIPLRAANQAHSAMRIRPRAILTMQEKDRKKSQKRTDGASLVRPVSLPSLPTPEPEARVSSEGRNLGYT